MLTQPLFWGALALLVFNDHLFKGSGLLPGWLTGKLSDLAGMVVAPLLLVALIGARRLLPRAACFAAVVLPFAAIKLSPDAAELLIALLSRIGVRWQIVVDPLDLLALAALPLAAWTLHRADGASGPPPSWRWLERAGVGAGIVACLASGEPDNWSAQAYVVNRTAEPLTLRMRPFAGQLDCDALGNDMVRALSPSGFAEGTTYAVGIDRTLPVRGQSRVPDPDAEPGPPVTGIGDCTVVLMQADGMPDMLVWWHDGDVPTLSVPLDFDEGDFAALGEGRIDINVYDGGRVRAENMGLAHVARAEREVEPSSCPVNAPRFQFSVATPSTAGDGIITAIDTLPDGCIDVSLSSNVEPPGSGGGGGAGGGVGGSGGGGFGGSGGGGGGGFGGSGGTAAMGPPEAGIDHLQLCIPSEAFPFQVGASLLVSVSSTGALAVAEPSGATLSVATASGYFGNAGWTAELSAVPCEGDRTECHAFVAPAALTVSSNGLSTTIHPGGSTQVSMGDGRTQTIWLGRAEHVMASNDGCAVGRDVLGLMADLVVLEQ